jgi:hypothetical protein
MIKTVYAVFDGYAFIPETPADLQTGQKYLIQILPEKSIEKPAQNVLKRILAKAKDLGVSDLAEQHDHYLYGTEKQ